MKKILSLTLIIAVLLLSGCELGTGGKAISIGGVNYLEVYQCQPSFHNVVNYIPSTEPCPKYDWSFGYDYARANCGALKDEAEGGRACGTMSKEESLLGYLKPLQNGQCVAGQIKIIECLVRTSASYQSGISQKSGLFDNNYMSTEQAGCIEGNKVKDIGCAEASPTANTKPIYLCTPQKHLDWHKGKYRWNWFASTSNYCGGWGANTQVNLGYWIQPSIAKAPAVPITQMPSLTACEQLKATNADLNNKIARVKEENALMEKQLSTIGGR